MLRVVWVASDNHEAVSAMARCMHGANQINLEHNISMNAASSETLGDKARDYARISRQAWRPSLVGKPGNI